MFRPRIIRGLLPFVRSISHSQSSPRSDNFIKIVEVGPRDGLQNEPNPVSLDVKVELINRLGQAGVGVIESGSFVSPKWVPQMAGTSEVLQQITHLPSVKYPVLVPNLKGLETLLSLLSSLSPSDPPITDEIAIFTASSDTFNLRNTNATVQQSLERLSPVVELALKNNLRVRGYVSTVITCPYEGPTEPKKVAQVTKDLVDMGCYEVSLGDTVGTGTPMTIGNMLDSVIALTPAEKLAIHCHDTFGMGVANVLMAIAAGIHTVDSSVAGLGGCPYSPGATGNVATEDIAHALHGLGYSTKIDIDALAQTGSWISEKLGRRNESRAGKAYLAKRLRAEKEAKEKA